MQADEEHEMQQQARNVIADLKVSFIQDRLEKGMLPDEAEAAYLDAVDALLNGDDESEPEKGFMSQFEARSGTALERWRRSFYYDLQYQMGYHVMRVTRARGRRPKKVFVPFSAEDDSRTSYSCARWKKKPLGTGLRAGDVVPLYTVLRWHQWNRTYARIKQQYPTGLPLTQAAFDWLDSQAIDTLAIRCQLLTRPEQQQFVLFTIGQTWPLLIQAAYAALEDGLGSQLELLDLSTVENAHAMIQRVEIMHAYATSQSTLAASLYQLIDTLTHLRRPNATSSWQAARCAQRTADTLGVFVALRIEREQIAWLAQVIGV